MQSDILTFLRSWAAEPLRVGAIAPSGSALADLITRDIGPHTGPVIELGPGTGVFTAKLLARGVPEAQLTLVEYGSDFARLPQLRYPEARVMWMRTPQVRSNGASRSLHE